MTHNPILCDFVSPNLAPKVPQNTSNAYIAWVFAKAECLRQGVSSASASEAIYSDMRALCERYAVAPSMIARRPLLAVPAAFSIPPSIFDSAGEPLTDLAADLDDVVYADLIRHHRDPEGASFGERLKINDALALRAFDQIYEGCESPPHDLIHVTSTSFAIPGVAQAFTARKGWERTRTTHCHQMMCRAAIPAARMATGFLRPGERVDIVHTELISPHQSALDHSPLSILAQSLFADGLVKYSVVEGGAARSAGGPALEILHLDELTLAGTLAAVGWQLVDGQLRHILEPTIPLAVRRNVRPFVEGLCSAIGLDHAAAKSDLLYAIHTGGARILDAVRNGVGADDEQLRHSREVFRENGNTSSASLPLVLKAIAEDDSVADGQLIVAVTFGPGLTVSGGVLRKIAG